MTVYAKDPGSNVDFSFDWSAWLTDGETITGAVWSAEPAGLSLGAEVEAGPVRGIYVSGGTAGNLHRLTCRVTTDAGRTAERSLALRVMEQ